VRLANSQCEAASSLPPFTTIQFSFKHPFHNVDRTCMLHCVLVPTVFSFGRCITR
jgi:hypothetical protein